MEYCPHDLFINTKVDLGPCQNIHDDNLKQTFQMAENSREKERRQEDFLKYIQRLLGDCDTRIKRAKEQFKQRQREALAAISLDAIFGSTVHGSRFSVTKF